MKEHAAAVSGEGHQFVPLAFETFGHFDVPVGRFIDDICEEIPAWRRRECKKEALIEMSTAIWRGNAVIVRNAVELLRRREVYALVTA